jgi:hypothetical protein
MLSSPSPGCQLAGPQDFFPFNSAEVFMSSYPLSCNSASFMVRRHSMTLGGNAISEGELYFPRATYIRLPACPTHPLSMDVARRKADASISDLQSHWNSFAFLAMRWVSPVRASICMPAAQA